MIVHTSRLFDRRAEALGPLDVTRKSGTDGLIWAPSWAILSPALKAFKAARGTAEREREFAAYRLAYLEEMRTSWRLNRTAWEALLSRPRLTLQCYCVDSQYCHRTLLARDILPGACARLGVSYDFAGEF